MIQKGRGFNFIMFGTDRQAMTMLYSSALKEYREL